ncbi:MAG: type VI secretion system protein TssA [Candidatus Accumulibacter sp.]|jgi:type VI secretion system protein VasJ|nr:type VI secretion system protein TssA [Accumulibacter sp.]
MPSSETDACPNNAGAIPIPGDSPAGKNVRDDPRFSLIRQEIDSLTSIQPDAAPPDWAKIADLGNALLTTLGKDISVASWFAAALLNLKGEEGIADGAAVLADLCTGYWETLFPPLSRIRARTGAIDWWQDQVERWLDAAKPEYLSASVHEIADQRLQALEEFINDTVPDNPLRLRTLRARLQRLPTPPEAAPPPPPDAPSDTSSAAPTSATGTPPAQNASRAAAPDAVSGAPQVSADSPTSAFLSECARFCLQTADTLLSRDLAHPASYVLRRSALWAELTQTPPTEGVNTRLPKPEEHLLPGLLSLFKAGEHKKVVYQAESCCNEYLFWLDLSRLSAQALAGLGKAYDVARLALESQTAGLLHRFPELAGMSFSDGTPFADSATRQWLAGLSGTGGGSDPFDAALAEAVAHPPAAALEALGRLLLRHPGDKYTLVLYRAAFQACLAGELWQPLPFLSVRLLEIVAAHRLSTYDSDAVAAALASAADALAAAATANPENSPVREQYARIAAELAGLQPHKLLPGG